MSQRNINYAIVRSREINTQAHFGGEQHCAVNVFHLFLFTDAFDEVCLLYVEWKSNLFRCDWSNVL